MSPQTGLLTGFLASLLIGIFGGVLTILVRIGLRRRRVPIRFGMSGMPTHLLRLCRELPPAPENDRLVRLAKWSLIAFLVAMVGGGITGPMLASLDQPCDDKPNSYQNECPKAAGRN
jgi:hypothetical protein